MKTRRILVARELKILVALERLPVYFVLRMRGGKLHFDFFDLLIHAAVRVDLNSNRPIKVAIAFGTRDQFVT
jgi:hypothetical protein